MSESKNNITEKQDIYFEKKYAELSLLLEEENSEVVEYVFEDDNGKISNLFIKRPIQIDAGLKNKYFDITTPYGYGGPLIEILKDDRPETKKKLLDNFKNDFEKYAKENNIVSEFIRFHPIIKNALDFKEIYKTKYLRETVATIVGKEHPFDAEFSKSSRKTTRRALREDIKIEIEKKPEHLNDFKKIYTDTMDRNDALDFYYFDDKYFDQMLELLNDNLLKINIVDSEETIIASGIYFIYGNKFLHGHLSGTKKGYLHMSPAYILKYATADWCFENGYKYIHYGGGTTSDPEDSLLVFKKRFTKEGIFDFYIGSKVYNKEVYDLLVEKTENGDSRYFPKYRTPYLKEE